jgi:hypothetical protein
MNKYEALRLVALQGAYKPDAESNVRYVMRWYSKTFHTPLHEVYDLPLEDVWLAFYEERYQALEKEDLEDEVSKALESPEARNEREMEDEAEKASALEFAKMSEAMNKVAKTVDKVKETLGAMKTPEATLPPAAPVVEEGIDMQFVDPEEMERLLSGGMATETKVDLMSFK